MHSEVEQEEPGECPECSMSLVKEEEIEHGGGMDHKHHDPSEGSEQDHSEHHRMMAEDFKKRFFVSIPLTFFILLLSPQMQQRFGFSVDTGLNRYILFILGSIIVYFGGKPFYQEAKNEIKSGSWGMMTLVSLGISAAYLFSVGSTFFFEGKSFYWEVATLVLAFLFGHWLEMRAVLGTGSALKELAKLIPPEANLIEAQGKRQEIKQVKTESLTKGDLVLVRPGEKIPVDGVVIQGNSSANEALITGESRPVKKAEGDEVVGGAINGDGSLTVRVTKTGKETALSQIQELVKNAQTTKPKVQKLADKAAHYLTITAIVAGSITFIYWSFFSPQTILFALTLAITVVVITCPHALGLAIPTVTTITSSIAARNGILIRDMRGLEAAGDVDHVVFDKTGTLTKGEFGITQIFASKKADDNELLMVAAGVDQHSEHSIARAILNEAKNREIDIPKTTDFEAVKGKGAKARKGSELWVVGNEKMMQNITLKSQISNLKISEVGTIVYVAKDKELLGAIVLADEIRKESKKAVEELHKSGIKITMLTGDKKDVAQEVADELNIDTVFAEVLPEDKINKIKELQGLNDRSRSAVMMVGDGINDAPALTQADVGIAIGAGTSVALESAEIVLVKNNPLDVIKVRSLAKATRSKMKQNLAWATGYNVIAIPIAAGILAPWNIFLQPQWGALVMSASSLIVVANALLLRSVDLD